MPSRKAPVKAVSAPALVKEILDITFDMSKISFDEMCDVLSLAGKSKTDFDGKDFANLIQSMRLCVTGSSRPLTGDDVSYVLQAFIAHVNGASVKAKN